MLSPDDADLVQRDPDLPGLALLLNPSALAAELNPFLQQHVHGGTCSYLRYKPHTSCLAALRFKLDTDEIGLYVKAYRTDALQKLRKARRRAPQSGTRAELPHELEAAALALFVYPDDAKVQSLNTLTRGTVRSDLLRDLLPQCRHLWTSDIVALRYKPEKRFVGQLLAQQAPAALLKCYTRSGYIAAHRNGKHFTSRGPLRVARRLAGSRRYRMLALEWIDGDLLGQRIGSSRTLADLQRELLETAAALSELHAQDGHGLRHLTPQHRAAALQGVAQSMGQLRPGAARRAAELAHRIGRSLADSASPRQPIHGDFYADQVVLGSGRIGIVDLDNAVLSDPAADLGNFIAHLHCDANSGRITDQQAEAAAHGLVEAYHRVADPTLTRRLGPYIAASLLRLAAAPFRAREPAWSHRMEQILDRAAAVLQSHGTTGGLRTRRTAAPATRQPLVVDAFELSKDPAMPHVSRALDPWHVTPLLERFADRIFGHPERLALHAIRVVRHKPGRRCLVEYHFQEWPCGRHAVLLAKIQAKPLKPIRFQQLEALWNAGFSSNSEDGISIPRPVAPVPELRMWLQERVLATSSTYFLKQGNAVPLARRIAEALHKVHAAGIEPSHGHTMADELFILRDRMARVAQQRPDWSRRLETLLKGCHELGEKLPRPEPRGIHRDFYPDQVLVHGERLYLVDFDLYCQGDPALDAGNFCGHLIELGLRIQNNPHALAAVQRSFVDRFLTLTPATTRQAISAYTTLTLARHIYLSTQHPRRQHLTERLLTLCEQRLLLAKR